MKNSDIERWALAVIQRLDAGEPIEDSRVELKTTWIEAEQAARRIAGHANAARGESILWLIGVNEKRGVEGVNYSEFQSWFTKIQAQFDEVMPHCYDLNVPVKGLTVLAMVFETDRAPYVVKNPDAGKPGAGAIKFEVPWREGTSVRTARRADLLLLFADTKPLSSLVPELEWNLGILGRTHSHLEEPRFIEIARVMESGSLMTIPDSTRGTILGAYQEIGKVTGRVKQYMLAQMPMERDEIGNEILFAKQAALPVVSAALNDLKAFLRS